MIICCIILRAGTPFYTTPFQVSYLLCAVCRGEEAYYLRNVRNVTIAIASNPLLTETSRLEIWFVHGNHIKNSYLLIF